MHKLEITIQRYREGYGWPVIVDQEETETFVHSRREGKLRIGGQHSKDNLREWTNELKGNFLKPKIYGQILGQALFDDPTLSNAFNKAIARADQLQGNLRIFLVVEDEALKAIHWERLTAPIGPGESWDFIAIHQRFPFTLYIPSLTDHAFPPIGRHELRTLLVVANVPKDNDLDLDHFDAKVTVESIRNSLAPIKCDILANVDSYPLPTLEEIEKHLTKRYYSILHIVAHGQFIKHGNDDTKGETFLYLDNGKGQVEDISAADFMLGLSRVRDKPGLPLLTFLGSCESAAPEAEKAGAFGGLAQRLVRDLSLPAVIAMTEKVSIHTAETLAREFYQRLHDTGQVDMALVEACVALFKKKDVTVPALYGRLGGHSLFTADANVERELTHPDILKGLERLEAELANDPSDAPPGQANKPGRAPILIPALHNLADTLRVNSDELNAQAHDKWNKALAEVNRICQDAVGLDFRGLAFGAKPPPYNNYCPFPGLLSFKFEDHEYFFRDEKLISDLTKRLLDGSGFLPMLGPSGSGKSSLVFAGILPALKKKMSDLRWATFTPSDSPLENLETALVELGLQPRQADSENFSPTYPSLLIIDQFEELFTLNTLEQRQLFIEELLKLIDQSRNLSTLLVILTMRADFWGDCAYHERLVKAMQNHPNIGPMETHELRSAMEEQAKKVGLEFEADLSYEILVDVKGEPGAMPLLQHALRELWYRRHGKKLVRDEYHAIGTTITDDGRELHVTGIKGAISHTATKLYNSLPESEKLLIRKIFLRLTRLGDEPSLGEVRRDTRRRVAFRKIVSSDGDKTLIEQLVEKLASSRLVVTNVNETTGEKEVEVAHETLIRHWPLLTRWLDEEYNILRLRADIENAAATYHANPEQDLLIHRGGPLNVIEQYLNTGELELNQEELAYISACIAQREEENERELQRTRKLEAMLLAAQSQLLEDPTGSLNLMLAREAVLLTTPPLPFADVALRRGVVKASQLPWYLTIPWRTGHTDGVTSVAYGPNGKQIISGSKDATIRRWDVQSGEPIGQPLSGHRGGVTSVAYSSEVSQIISGSMDGKIRRWDLESGKPIGESIGKQVVARIDWVTSVAYSPDGKQIVSGSRGGKIRRWDAQSGEPIGEPLDGHDGWVTSVAYSPDGKEIISGGSDKTIRRWDVKSGKPIGDPLVGHTGWVTSVAYSQDEEQIISGSEDKTIRRWNRQRGGQIGEPLLGHTEAVTSVACSPGQIASCSRDGTTRRWDVKSGKPIGEPFIGHIGWVNSVAYSPDGKKIVSGGEDRTIRFWDAQSGEPIGEIFVGHIGKVASVACSPDGTQIVSGGSDTTIRRWNGQSGESIGIPLVGHKGKVTSVACSPDGKQIVSGSEDKTIRRWDAQSGEPIGEPLEGHTGKVTSVAYRRDDKQIISGGDDGTIRRWDAKSGEPIGDPLLGHTGKVTSMAWSPEGTQIVSASEDRTIRLWDAQSGEPIGEILIDVGVVISVACSPDGKQIISGGSDQTIRRWDMQSGEPIGDPLVGHTDAVTSVTYSPDGKQIISGSEDKTICRWDAQSGEPIGDPLVGHIGKVTSVAYSPNGKQIISGGDDGTIHCWNSLSSEPIGGPLTSQLESITSMAWSRDDKQIISGSDDGTIRRWDAQSGEPIGEPLLGHTDAVTSVAYGQDDKQIISGSEDKTIRRWDVQSGKPIGEPLLGHTDAVTSVAYGQDDKQIISGSKDMTIRRWDAQSGEPIGEPLEGHTGWVTSVACSPDGKQIISGSNDGTIRRWDAQSGETIDELLEGHTGWVTSVAYSQDDKQFISGSNDGTIRRWDMQSGEPIGDPLVGHTDAVTSVTYRPDGKQIISGSEDKTIRRWDAQSGELIGEPLVGHTRKVTSVAWSLDGTQIVSGSEDGTIRLWVVSESILLQLADALIHRDPPIFSFEEKHNLRVKDRMQHEKNLGDPVKLQVIRIDWLSHCHKVNL